MIVDKMIFLLLLVTLLGGCDSRTLTPQRFIENQELSLAKKYAQMEGDLYQDHVQKLFDNRCVVCHSCYNSPCQVKLSSYEGAERGGSKIKVYDGTRMHPIKPTRLFQDAQSEKEWRQKGFYSVLQNNDATHASSLEQLVALKRDYKNSSNEYHEYYPEAENLTCSKDQQELSRYLKENPHQGMPFGFPPLTTQEESLLGYWFQKGAPGPSSARLAKLLAPRNGKVGEQILRKWEIFLNQDRLKARVMSRYLFEHLFLAHIQFREIPGDTYRLVRSLTAYPEPIHEIATVRPYDDPKVDRFYYRFRKVISTIVHKTHITYPLSLSKMQRFKQLFLDVPWKKNFIFPSYEPKIAANPFRAFQMIPAKSRYQFLLDNNHYFVMTFIRGPVCKGQLALNSIRDHFSVVFLSPDKDLYVKNRSFENDSISLLATPIEGGSNFIKSFYYKYHMLEQKYVERREKEYAHSYPQGSDLSFIWPGNDEGEPVLTIYRHLDSATVLAGQHGGVPKTLWVIDYPLFERIYYTLVAGFNVFGNISHQLFVRTYMDDMRIEGEDNFLSFIPLTKRFELHRQWHKGDQIFAQFYFFWERKLSDALGKKFGGTMPTKLKYSSNQYVKNFLTQLYDRRLSRGPYVNQDRLNNHKYQRTHLDTTDFSSCSTEKCVDGHFSFISNRYGAFVKAFPEERLDLIFVRVRDIDGKAYAYTLVKNKARLNVDTLFNEDGTRNPNSDTFNVFKGFIGSYPNLYFDINMKQVEDFFEDLVQLKPNDNSFYEFVDKYGVRRLDRNFWELHDWFTAEFKRLEPTQAGVFDLNRYANIPHDIEQKRNTKSIFKFSF